MESNFVSCHKVDECVPYDVAIQFLPIYSAEMCAYGYEHMCIRMMIGQKPETIKCLSRVMIYSYSVKQYTKWKQMNSSGRHDADES